MWLTGHICESRNKMAKFPTTIQNHQHFYSQTYLYQDASLEYSWLFIIIIFKSLQKWWERVCERFLSLIASSLTLLYLPMSTLDLLLFILMVSFMLLKCKTRNARELRWSPVVGFENISLYQIAVLHIRNGIRDVRARLQRYVCKLYSPKNLKNVKLTIPNSLGFLQLREYIARHNVKPSQLYLAAARDPWSDLQGSTG